MLVVWLHWIDEGGVCASLTPAIFEPGRADLILARPVSRHWVVLGRYLGSVAS